MALMNLSLALEEVEQGREQALQIIASLENRDERASALRELGLALAKALHWQQARQVITTIEVDDERARTLKELDEVLAMADYYRRGIESNNIWTMGWDYYWRSQGTELLEKWTRDLTEAGQEEQAEHIWQQVQVEIAEIERNDVRTETVQELVQVLIKTHRWQQAWAAIATIEDSDKKASALRDLGLALAKVNRWQHAYDVIATIKNNHERTEAMSALGHILTQVWDKASTAARSNVFREAGSAHGRVEVDPQLLRFLQNNWFRSTSYFEILSALPLAYGLILLKPVLGIAFFQAFAWVDAFLKGGDENLSMKLS